MFESLLLLLASNTALLSPTVISWISKLEIFAFMDVYHSLVLPLSMVVPEHLPRRKVASFYVRHPVLSPQKEVEPVKPSPPTPPPPYPPSVSPPWNYRKRPQPKRSLTQKTTTIEKCT